MKKIYTLVAVSFMAIGAMAQNDFSANLITPAVGATTDADPLSIDFEVVNNSDNTYSAEDTLWVGMVLDGDIFGLDLTPGNVSGFILGEELAPGASYTIPTVTIDWLEQDEATTVDVCVIVYGVGTESFSGEGPSAEEIIVGDDDVSNNTACFTAELPVVDDSGIEDLGLSLTNVYVANDQLMIVNDGSNGNVVSNLSIVNMNGQTVQAENLTLVQGTNTVSLDNLPAGIYVVAIEVEGTLVTRKVAVQ